MPSDWGKNCARAQKHYLSTHLYTNCNTTNSACPPTPLALIVTLHQMQGEGPETEQSMHSPQSQPPQVIKEGLLRLKLIFCLFGIFGKTLILEVHLTPSIFAEYTRTATGFSFTSNNNTTAASTTFADPSGSQPANPTRFTTRS